MHKPRLLDATLLVLVPQSANAQGGAAERQSRRTRHILGVALAPFA